MSNKRYTDDELIKLLRGEAVIEEPVRFIYKEYFALLSNYIENNNGSEQDAEDIFQETVLSFIELVRQDKFKGESSVKTFLYAVNRNIWLNERKKRSRQDKRHLQVMKEEETAISGIEKYVNNRESRQQVFAMIDALGETCKTILIAFYYENLSIADILTKLDYENEQVVRNKKGKCMKSLQEKLNANPTLANIMKKALQYE